MMQVTTPLLLFVLLAAPLIAGQFSPEKHVKLGWQKVDIPSEHELVKFSMYLKQQNLHTLEKIFWDVSNPKSESYGNYLSMQEITEIVAPTEETILKVTKWLVDNHITDIEFVENKDVVIVSANVKTIEQMFGVKLANFQHSTGKTIIRSATMYEIPSHLTEEIDFIRGISNFPIVSPRSKLLYKAPIDEARLGEPVFERVRARSNEFTIGFSPTCLFANSTNTIPPCNDHPPALANVTVSVVSASDVVDSSVSVTVVPTCVNEAGSIMCTVILPGVGNYHLYNLSIQASFVGGQQSSVVDYGYPVMASPALTPEAIKNYYNIPVGQRVINSNVTQAVGEFEQQYYDQADLLLFFKQMGLPYDTPVTVIGPNNQSNPGVEANLDIQYIMGIGVSAPTTFWSIYANSSIEIDDILAWAVAMSNTENPPIVNSLSYGMTEMAVDLFLGKGYLNRSDVEFQKLATRGITIIIADGDAGAGDLGEAPMSADTCMPLHADWPSQSQFVTAVSATMFTPLAEAMCYLPKAQGGVDCSDLPLGEVPTSVLLGTAWTTGGGFSNTSSRPSYQDDFVAQYIATLTEYGMLPPQEYFNANGRAYPDVAMVGHNLLIAQNLTFMTVDGTSASAPVFAGFISLLNDIRVMNEMPMLGFLNPLLYQIARDFPGAYNDVVYGNNRCGDVNDEPYAPVCCPYGYEAVPGFDTVSGLGSPNFEVFAQAILNY